MEEPLGSIMKKAGRTIPSFFILGQPRSGTTALASYLADHPSIFMSPMKEPYFFDTDLKGPKISEEQYLSLFSEASPGVHQAVGEATPTYFFSDAAVPAILKFNPKAKFIVILRNYFDFLRSLHAQKVYWGEDNIEDFEEAWRAQADRRQDKRIPVSCRDPKWLLYSDWAMHGRLLKRLYSRVPRNRVKVVIFKDFAVNPRQTYEEILTFLGVPQDGRKKFPIINEGRAVRIMWLQQLYSLLFSAGLNFRKKVGLGLRNYGIAKKLLSINSKPVGTYPLSEDFRDELRQFYSKDLKELSRLLKRDMSFWFQ
jgi:hypothetical protein